MMSFENSANVIHKQFSSASTNVFLLNHLRTVEYSLYFGFQSSISTLYQKQLHNVSPLCLYSKMQRCPSILQVAKLRSQSNPTNRREKKARNFQNLAYIVWMVDVNIVQQKSLYGLTACSLDSIMHQGCTILCHQNCEVGGIKSAQVTRNIKHMENKSHI